MKLFKMMLLGLLMTGVYAQAAKWEKLKPLESYSGSAYSLKENVAYMEIREYKTKKSKKASKTLALYRKPLKSYSEEVVRKFKALRAKYSTKADIGSYGNAFFIDTKGKMFQMDMREDIISLLGKIDRPAEVQLILSLYHEEHGKYYKKTAKGYKVKIVEPLVGCTSLNRRGSVDKSGNYNSNFGYSLSRKGCKKREHTRFVSNRKLNYERYSKIEMDSKGNLYVIGEVNKNDDGSSFDSSFYVLEKYSANGKRLWSRRLKGYTTELVVTGKLVYVFGEGNLPAIYTLNGKKKSSSSSSEVIRDKKGNISIFGKKIEQRVINDKKYFPEGLPNKKEKMDAHISDYLMDKKGNVYLVGSEVFYPSGSPDEVPSGECGMVEQVHGALIAKLNSKGKTIWVKVIDRNE